VAVTVRRLPVAVSDWTVFVNASELLFGVERSYYFEPGGLSLYANYPQFQVGPLSVLVATPFRLLGDVGRQLAIVAMAAVPLVLWWWMDRLERRDRVGRRSRARWSDADGLAMGAVAGALLVVGWVPLSGEYLHLDDALALAAMVAAVVEVGRDRGVRAGLWVGAAMAAKPWAALFAPLLLVVRGRSRWRALTAAAGVAALAWGPFVVADPGTLGAGAPTVDVSRDGVLHLLGADLGVGPAWVRSAQLLVGGLAGLACVLRHRWRALPMVVIAVRLLLDPGTFGYYTSGLLLATVLWDRWGSPFRLPWATVATFVGLHVPEVVGLGGSAAAVLRAGTCLGLCALAVAAGPEPDAGGGGAAGAAEPRPAATVP